MFIEWCQQNYGVDNSKHSALQRNIEEKKTANQFCQNSGKQKIYTIQMNTVLRKKEA